MQLQLSRKTDLALAALRVIHQAGRRMGAGELAASVRTTATYLPQAMAPLVRMGCVISQPGPHGGYELAADLHHTTVLEVIEAVEGPVDDGQCVLRNGPCSTGQVCSLHDSWARARSAMISELARTPVVADADCRWACPPLRGGRPIDE